MVLRRKLFTMVLGLPLLAQGAWLGANTIPEMRQICEKGMSWQQSRKIEMSAVTKAKWELWHFEQQSEDMPHRGEKTSQTTIKSGLVTATAEEDVFLPDPPATHVSCQVATKVGFTGPELTLSLNHCAEFNAEIIRNRGLDSAQEFCYSTQSTKSPKQQQQQTPDESSQMLAEGGHADQGRSLADFMRVDPECTSEVLETITTCTYYR